MKPLRVSNGRFANRLAAASLLAVAFLAACSDAAPPTDPHAPARALNAASADIVVTNVAELVAALAPEHAGQRILVRAGTYALSAPLTVPDGVTLEGEGIMQFDGAGRPTGFAPGTGTTLTMATNTPGNLLTLGNGASIRGLGLVDLPGRAGNVVAVVSRDAGDRVSATIAEAEIINPNAFGAGPDGSTGYGLFVVTRNPNLGAAPAPHDGAALDVRMVRSLIRSPAGGGSVFAFNFASFGQVSIALTGNIVGGEVTANGGVSRPDAVHDSWVGFESHQNLYRNDSQDQCASLRRGGWNLTGGSGPPAPLPVPETARNSLRWYSVDDRIEGFPTAINATGARRFFPSPTAGPSTDNSIDFKMLGGTIATPTCAGAQDIADLHLAGALSANAALVPGDGNSLRAVITGVTGSGTRFNQYGDAVGPAGPLPPAFQGTGNRLTIDGSPMAFAQTNRNIDPAPGAEFFTARAP